MNDPDVVRDLVGDPDVPPARRDPEGSQVWLASGTRLSCVTCGGQTFTRREVLMNTSGMSFLDLDWANKSAVGAVCRTCGFVHAFLDAPVEWR